MGFTKRTLRVLGICGATACACVATDSPTQQNETVLPLSGNSCDDPRRSFTSNIIADRLRPPILDEEDPGYRYAVTLGFTEENRSGAIRDGNMHLGVDYDVVGTDRRFVVRAAGNGVVVFAGYVSPDWGYMIRVLHRLPDGTHLVSKYAHLEGSYENHASTMQVRVGESVSAGQAIGAVGATPYENGGVHTLPHVHFELTERMCNEAGNGYAWTSGAHQGWRDPIVEFARFGYLPPEDGAEPHVLTHPEGTLVQIPERTDPAERAKIYRIGAGGAYSWIANESAYLSRRLFHDSRAPWQLVTPITEQEFRCHPETETLSWPVTMKMTRCVERAGLQWSVVTFLATDDRGMRTRRRVPFVESDTRYGLLLASWGFRPEETVTDRWGCDFVEKEPLTLRSGTVVRQQGDADFVTTTDDEFGQRLRRNLFLRLGLADSIALHATAGVIPSLIRGMHHDNLEFTTETALRCPANAEKLVAAWLDRRRSRHTASASVGGASQSSTTGGQPPVTESTDTPLLAASELSCGKGAEGADWSLHIGRPAPQSVFGMTDMNAIRRYTAGGDGSLGWSPSSASQWQSDPVVPGSPSTLRLPADAKRLTPVALDENGRAFWFDLRAWRAASGSTCRIAADGNGGLVLVRDPLYVAPPTNPPIHQDGGTNAPPPDAGTMPPQGPYVRCTIAGSGMRLEFGGDIVSALVGGTTSAPQAIRCGSDSHGWDLPSSPVQTDFTTNLPISVNLGFRMTGFNCAVLGADGRDAWLDLIDADNNGTRFTVVGDCRVEGTKIVLQQ